MSNNRLRFTLLPLALALLAGCSSAPPKPEASAAPEVMQQFQRTFQTALRQSIASSVQQDLIGAARLRLKVNREGRAVACKTMPATPDIAHGLATQQPFTDPAAFNLFIERQCWQAIYPKAPEALYDDKGVVEVVAPVGVAFSTAQPAPWQQENRQRAFFREKLLANEQVDSIGVAIISYQTDATGKATGCLVHLMPSVVRPDDFKLDGGLQSRLTGTCMKLDLSRMPGFALNRQQQAEGMISLQYAPWVVGRP